MIIKKNKKGTYDLTDVSVGKLMAIVNGLNDLQELHENNRISSIQSDVRDLIKNNPDFQKDTKQV